MKNIKIKGIIAAAVLCVCGIGTFGASHNSSIVSAAQATPKPTVKPTHNPTSKPTGKPGETTDNDEDIIGEKGYLTENELDKIKFSFEKDNYAVILNQSIEARFTSNIPKDFVRYTVEGVMPSVASVNGILQEKKTVKIKGDFVGSDYITITANVEYCDDEGNYAGVKKLHAKTRITTLGTVNEDMFIGDFTSLTFTQYEAYDDMKYEFTNPNIVLFEGNKLTGIAAGTTSVYLVAGTKKIFAGQITIRGNGISMAETEVTRAVGSAPYQLNLYNAADKSVRWSSSNVAVAAVNSTGQVNPLAVGEAVITAYVKGKSGFETSYTCKFVVTNPVLSLNSVTVAKGYEIVVSISGTKGGGVWNSANQSVASVYSSYEYDGNNQAVIRGYKKGTTTVSVMVDGVTKTLNVTVTNPSVNKTFNVLYKGAKSVIKVKGKGFGSVVKYSTSNKSVAIVSKTGVVKAKKNGFARITVNVDGANINVAVNVGSKKAVKSVMKAVKVEGAIYSQARRMSKGYYDCSSLVWRSYKSQGAYFGDRHYAPVAANEALYCVRHKMSVKKRYINKLKKLMPGDLVFYSKSLNNGRYKNIYHVAIYMGQDVESFGNETYTYGRIIHANGKLVTQSMLYNQSNCSVIGRPFK